MYASRALACLIMAVTAAAQTQIFNFSYYVDIENCKLRPNGMLVLDTFDDGRMYMLDPTDVGAGLLLNMSFPNVTAITGIAAVGDDKFAVSGGLRGHLEYTDETVFLVDFAGSDTPTVMALVEIPDAILLNGMAALPAYPEVIMMGDSRLGIVFRVNTTSGAYDAAFEDVALQPPATAATPLGINGLKIYGDYLYYTNTARNTFGRVPITPTGDMAGDVETIATLNATGDDWDDFIIDQNTGIAYVAQPIWGVSAIYPNGTVALAWNGTATTNPTSLAIANDNVTMYITTRGDETVDVALLSGGVTVVSLA